MATTDGRLAREAVATVVGGRNRIAVIHGEQDLSAGVVLSDVDLVSQASVGRVVEDARKGWAALGLWPIIVWPYDVAGTGTVFLATARAEEGVQLDFLSDPDGRGKYGARSGEMLSSVGPGAMFPVVDPAVATVYLLAKRLKKGQIDRARALAADLEAVEVVPLAQRLLRPRPAQDVIDFVREGRVAPPTRGAMAPGRIVRRILVPVGAWVDVPTSAVASGMAARFGRFLPASANVGLVTPTAWLQAVAALRWRPGLAVSHGRRALPLRPDLRLAAQSVDEACADTVSFLATRRP